MNVDPNQYSQRSTFRDFLSFRTMVSCGLIKVVYAGGAVLITLVGLAMLDSTPGGGLAVILVGNLVWRVMAEGGIVLFDIHELLAEIRDRLSTSEDEQIPRLRRFHFYGL